MMNSKWLIAVLTVSIILNLLLIGFTIGRISHHPQVDPAQAFPRWARTLPEPRRQELRPNIHQHFRQVRPHLRLMRKHQNQLNALIVAEPLDTAALESVLVDIRQTHSTVQTDSHAAFIKFIQELSPAERQAFVSRPQRKRPHKNRRPREHLPSHE